MVGEGMDLRRRGQEVGPHMPARGDREVVIFQRNVDSGLKCRIDIINPVSSQEEDAFVIFQDTEEDLNR